MRAKPSGIITSAWGCLALLIILLVTSLAIRLYAYAYQSNADGMPAGGVTIPQVDLGAGFSMPLVLAERYRVPVSACSSPALVNAFVWAGPRDADPSLADAVNPGDRIVYVWRGWNLGHRFATTSLNVIYFMRLAQARLTTGRDPTANEAAIKITIPSGCDASPNEVMASLRNLMRS